MNLNLKDLEKDPVFQKYFNGIPPEEGIKVRFFLNRELGIDLILDEKDVVKSIHFYSVGTTDIKEFTDKLPYNLSFKLTKDRTREMFGVPDFTGGGDFSFLHGVVPMWDKYTIDNIFLHIQFTGDGKGISLLTLDRKSD